MIFAKRIKKSLSKHVSYVVAHPEEFAILPKYFTRVRKWPLARILSILFNILKSREIISISE
jgi:hypothetical protein